MKYIGPFLRINTLDKTNISNQLLHLSKEAINLIVLHSKCGVTIKAKDLRTKNISNDDINIFDHISPLLCLYKKCSSKLKFEGKKLNFQSDSFRKDILIRGNAFMTLSLLELYENFKESKNQELKNLGELYLALSRHQLDFYASNLRNAEGLFVDKKDVSDVILKELKFEIKKNSYNYSDQGLLMCAFYKYGLLTTSKSAEAYKDFALDILKMFKEFKEDIYQNDIEELLNLCFSMNLFYKISNIPDSLAIAMDIHEFIQDNYEDITYDNCYLLELSVLNSKLLYENSNILKHKELYEKQNEKLLSLYNDTLSMFIKKEKPDEFTSEEIILYIVNLLNNNNNDDDDRNYILSGVFRNQLIDSGIILSWPDAPNLDSCERYVSSSLRSEDLIDIKNFRVDSMPTPETSNFAPIFIKNVEYSRKKNKYKQGKQSLDTSKNMFLYFLLLHFLSKK